MSTTRCRVCGLGPAPEAGGLTVYRENEPGQSPAVWACRKHRTKSCDVQDVVDALESGPTPEES